MIPISRPGINVLPTPTDILELKVGNINSLSLDFKNEDATQILNIDVYRKGNIDADYSLTGKQELTGIGPGESGNFTAVIGSEVAYKFVATASGIGLTANVKGNMSV